MTHQTLTGAPVHHAALMHASEYAAGLLGRREFLTRATSLGLTAAGAYGLIGLPMPAAAQEAAREGGTLRIQMDIRPLKDPRVWDWTQIANVGRGWLEYLVAYERDGTFRPMLLSGWEVNDDASQYTLTVRPGVTWNNGDPFTAEHVAHNFRRWADATVEGNSMASRVPGLTDPDTQQPREGAIEVVDEGTVRLNLSAPDIALIANVSDYPAAVVHPSYEGGDFSDSQIGTGPYLLESFEVGVKAVLVRNPDHDWWGAEVEGFGGATLDRIEYIDYGTDPAAWLAALDAGEVDMLYESVGEYIAIMDGLDLVKSEAVTANTVTVRPNQLAEVDGMRPYEDVRVRRALQLATDNAVVLELGYSGLGIPAENHHVCPIHPEYADIGPPVFDPAAAVALMEEAGMMDFEHEMVSLDDDFLRNTTDAVAAQLRDAGFQVKRTILPGATFWNDWTKYAFSSTNWNQRPLGVQVLALAYRTGEAWNETGYSNPEFDAALIEAMGIADADARRVVMERLETILREDGVVIQPYWQTIARHYTVEVTGAAMHPAYEIRPYEIGLRA